MVSLRAVFMHARQFLQKPFGGRPTAMFTLVAVGAILGIALLPGVTTSAQAAVAATVAVSPTVSAAPTVRWALATLA